MKFPQSAYDSIDPAYELMDDGHVRHRITKVIRPHYYSDLPIPFKVGQKVKVVDGNHEFPVSTIHTVSHIQGGIVYLGGKPVCWERLDPIPEEPVAYLVFAITGGKHVIHNVKLIDPSDTTQEWKSDDDCCGDYWAGNEPLFRNKLEK